MAPTRTAENEPIADSETKQRKKPGRAPVSCAECRRLKLRCDRKVPCETCTKRGCAALCPDGSLPTTKGPKKAAADVEQLKTRIQQLEAALRTLQGTVSDEPHPLLSGNPVASYQSIDNSPPASSSASGSPQDQEERDEDTDLLDAFGTLTLGTRGEARYFGQTSRTEYLIHAPERLAAYVVPKLPHVTDITLNEANVDLDVFCTSDAVAEEMLSCMPPITKLLRLCEVFFAYSKFLWYPIPKEYIMDDVIPSVYNPNPADASYCHVTKKHGVSLLWMICALGTLFDLNMPPYAAEAHEYYLFARLALRWAPPAYDTTLAALQSLIYMSIYLEMSDCEPAHTGSHKAWMQIRHAASLGQSIGLHVSSSKWQLDHTAAAKRGRIFWQLATYDAWLSFGYGRPPSISLAFVDCEFPSEEDAVVNKDDPNEAIFHVWNWKFTRVLHAVMNTAFAAKSPTYAKIFELDKRIRDFPVPPTLRLPCGGGSDTEAPSVTLTMQRLLVTINKETTLLNLHRPYFSLAVKDAAEDPLRHKYGPSVMSIYRSAWRISSSMQAAYRIAPGVTARIGLVWSHTLACAILLCLLITRASSSTLAGPCLVELDKICTLFEEAAGSGQSQVAANNIDVIQNLRKQAQAALTNVRTEDAAAVAAELDRLGGKTQLIRTIGERILRCHSLARPPPAGWNLSSFEVSVALDAPPAPSSSGARTPYSTGSANVTPRVQGSVNGQVSMVDFPAQNPVAELTEADLAAMLDFEIAGAMWDPSLNGSLQETAEFMQPNVADAEATWQALVQQLGI